MFRVSTIVFYLLFTIVFFILTVFESIPLFVNTGYPFRLFWFTWDLCFLLFNAVFFLIEVKTRKNK